MSSKMQAQPLLRKHYLSNEHTLILSNPHGYSNYDNELEGNLKTIINKYPDLDQNKVRNLLEELENNLQLAIKVLDQEEQVCNSILEEKKVDIKKPLKLSQEEENQIFKQQFLKLYKKYIKVTKEKQELSKKMEAVVAQNQKLKLMNKFLLEGEYSQAQICNNTDIC